MTEPAIAPANPVEEGKRRRARMRASQVEEKRIRPLVTPEGYSVGTICVMDFEPRELTVEQQEGLKRLSQQTVAQLIATRPI